MKFFKRLHKSISKAPPKWTPAPEESHIHGKLSEAPEEEYEAAERFCQVYSVSLPRTLLSHVINQIQDTGATAWGIEHPALRRFSGTITAAVDNRRNPGVVRVQSRTNCGDVCLMSDLPILAGLYDIRGQRGVYYEIMINHMEGIIAIGTACRPYPEYRFPGWNRLSAGLHLDDLRKFFEDPDGGRDYTPELTHINPGDIIGCAYEFATGALFYTHNGHRLPVAFYGLYLPRYEYDVFAAIGVAGECDFDINFGGASFMWEQGNERTWKIEGHVGGGIAELSGLGGNIEQDLPAYPC